MEGEGAAGRNEEMGEMVDQRNVREGGGAGGMEGKEKGHEG